MPICSYVVIPAPGAAELVRERLVVIPGCDVALAQNRDLLLLVTDTTDLRAEADLRASIEAMDGIEALLLTFGEIDPDAAIADPIGPRRARRRDSGNPRPDGSPAENGR